MQNTNRTHAQTSFVHPGLRRRRWIVAGWIGLAIAATSILVAVRSLALEGELRSEMADIARAASQRADQHDAHLTALSALAVATGADREDLFLDVAATIRRFYPRIEAIDLVPLGPGDVITTRPGLPDGIAAEIRDAARASDGALVLRAATDGRYLLVKRSPNTDEARFGLALTIDAERLLAADAPFWSTASSWLSVLLPGGQRLLGEDRVDEPQEEVVFGSASQPLVLQAGIAPGATDLLPLRILGPMLIVLTLIYALAQAGMAQVIRARRAEGVARLSADEAKLAHAARVNALGEMASGIAHELTQPLTAILSQAQAGARIAQGESAPRSGDGFASIVAQSKRAARILARLRDWTRPQAAIAEDVALGDVVQNVLALMQRDIQAADVVIDDDLKATGTTVVHLDRIALEQIIFNLLRNALDALTDRDGGRIAIRARPDGTAVVVDIIDNGPGVPEAIRDRVFDPFVTARGDGTGLGLALCQRLAERMGGGLTLEPSETGAVFRLRVPVSIAVREAAE